MSDDGIKTGMEEVADNIESACKAAGASTIAEISLEKPDPRLLDVRDGEFDEHVSMQPSAIAYYGVLKKQAARALEGMKQAYERWKKRKFQEARQLLEATSTKKITIADVESAILIKHEAEIEKWEDDIAHLQEQSDTMDVWYDAWRQKSFSLREHGQTLSDERRTQPYLYTEDSTGDGSSSRTTGLKPESASATIKRLKAEKKAKRAKGD